MKSSIPNMESRIVCRSICWRWTRRHMDGGRLRGLGWVVTRIVGACTLRWTTGCGNKQAANCNQQMEKVSLLHINWFLVITVLTANIEQSAHNSKYIWHFLFFLSKITILISTIITIHAPHGSLPLGGMGWVLHTPRPNALIAPCCRDELSCSGASSQTTWKSQN